MLRYGLTAVVVAGICLVMCDSRFFPLPNLAGLMLVGAGMLGIMATE